MCVSEYFEMLDTVAALDGEGKVAGGGFADAYDEGTLVLVGQEFFGVGPRDAAVVPAVRLHLNVI